MDFFVAPEYHTRTAMHYKGPFGPLVVPGTGNSGVIGKTSLQWALL
jgi:hypothetical protein